MNKKKKYLRIALIVIAILAAITAIIWLAVVLFPYLIMIIIVPTWLAAALADGAKV